MVHHYANFGSNVGLRSSYFPRLNIHSHPAQIHHYRRHADKIICRDVLSTASGNRTRFAKERAVLKQCDSVMGIGVREERASQGPSAQGAQVCHWTTGLVLLGGRNFAFFVLCKLFKHYFKWCKCIPVFYIFANMWLLNFNKPLNCTWNFYQLSSYIHHC